jgi:hypothetical protein
MDCRRAAGLGPHVTDCYVLIRNCAHLVASNSFRRQQMKLITITPMLLSAALFGGCAALPAGSDGYASSAYYAVSGDYTSPGYYPSPTYYDPPAYYAPPVSYAPPVYYAPSFGVSSYAASRGGEWNRDRAGSSGRFQQNRASYAAPSQVAPSREASSQAVRAQNNPAWRGGRSQAATSQVRVQDNRAWRGVVPQAAASQAPIAQVNRASQAAVRSQGEPSRGTAQRGRQNIRG